MTKPSVNAALKRMERWAADAPNDPRVWCDVQRDLAVVCAALRLVTDCAEHTDDADAQPIFTVRLPCDWRVARKGFLACLTASQGRTAEDVG